MNLLLSQNPGQYSGNTRLLSQQCYFPLQHKSHLDFNNTTPDQALYSLYSTDSEDERLTASPNGGWEFIFSMTLFKPNLAILETTCNCNNHF